MSEDKKPPTVEERLDALEANQAKVVQFMKDWPNIHAGYFSEAAKDGGTNG